MKKFVQIVENTAHWIFEAEELPPYPNPEDFIDITGRDGISEGDLYNAVTGEFLKPELPNYPEFPIEQEQPPAASEDLTTAITELREKLEGDNLTMFDMVVSLYEKTTEDNLIVMEQNTTVFEEVHSLKQEIAELKSLLQ